MIDWLLSHQRLLKWLFVLSILAYLATAVAIRIIVVRMSPDYFMHKGPPPDSWRAAHPVVRWLFLIVKNMLGILLIAVGILQCIPILVPGVGALTILVGILLLNFPGKRALELRLVRTPPVRKGIDWIRHRNGKPSLQLPDRRD